MKVAIIIEWRNPPVFGWWQVHTEYLCKYLVEDFGCKVDLFTRKLLSDNGEKHDQKESYLWNKWRIFRIWPLWLFSNRLIRILHILYFTLRFLYKAKKEKYDLIHAHALLPWISWKIVSFLLGIPIVYTVHGSMHLDVWKKNIYYFVEKILITCIKYTKEIVVSHNTLQYKNTNKNISVVHNGVDINAFDTILSNKNDAIFRMLTVWRIDWQKNHIAGIDAIHHIDKTILEKVGFMRVIVWDWPLKSMCEQKVQEYWLTKYILFTGKKFGEDLIKEYKNADIFFLPSLAEGQPLTVLEAFAAKIPVIATDVGDNAYIIKDKINGFLLPVNNIHAIKDTISIIINNIDKKKLIEYGQAWYHLMKESYDWHKVVENTYNVYKEVIHI